jgi:hypothetical protein
MLLGLIIGYGAIGLATGTIAWLWLYGSGAGSNTAYVIVITLLALLVATVWPIFVIPWGLAVLGDWVRK